MERRASGSGGMECLRHQKPPSYPPVVVVDSTVGVVPSMSPGLLSLAAIRRLFLVPRWSGALQPVVWTLCVDGPLVNGYCRNSHC